MFTNVSAERSAYINKIPMFSGTSTFFGLLGPEDIVTAIVRNVGSYYPECPRKIEASFTYALFLLAFHGDGSDLQNCFKEVWKPLFNSFERLHTNVVDSVPCRISFGSSLTRVLYS
jgi:hypothetical protein